MKLSLRAIADLLAGRVQGDDTHTVENIAKIEEATPKDLSFLANPKYEPFLYTTKAGVVLVNEGFTPQKALDTNLIFVQDAYVAFSQLLAEYHRQTHAHPNGIETPTFLAQDVKVGDNFYLGAFAYVAEGVEIGKNVKIYPHTYIGKNVQIGDNTVIYAGVKIYPQTQIGAHCTIHSGTVIGSDGFGFAPQADGTYQKIPQVGNVILENHVEVGANTVIDCATMGSTVIEEGVKLDNLIQIAHNVRIGMHTVVAAQTGISGSSSIGKNSMIGGQVGIVGHVHLADKIRIAARSGVTKSVRKKGATLQGAPAFDHKQSLKSYAVYKNLPDLEKKLLELEAKIATLTSPSE